MSCSHSLASSAGTAGPRIAFRKGWSSTLPGRDRVPARPDPEGGTADRGLPLRRAARAADRPPFRPSTQGPGELANDASGRERHERNAARKKSLVILLLRPSNRAAENPDRLDGMARP